MINKLEDSRKSLLQYLDTVRKSVECATQIDGDFKWERPSLRPELGTSPPQGFYGTTHLRYTMMIDVTEPLPPLKDLSELGENYDKRT